MDDDRREPNLTRGYFGDLECSLESMAISLKRIADALTQCDQCGQTGSAAIATAIRDGMRDGRP